MQSKIKENHVIEFISDTATQIKVTATNQSKCHLMVIEKIDYYGYLINNDYDHYTDDYLDIDGNHQQVEALHELEMFDTDTKYIKEYLLNNGQIIKQKEITE